MIQRMLIERDRNVRMLPTISTPGCTPSVTKVVPTGNVQPSDDLSVKSMPIHCIVEQQNGGGAYAHCDGTNLSKEAITDSRIPSAQPVIEMDTYAILPGKTMFNELIRTALVKIGYTASEAVGARGAIQIKNWKPLSFETITENPNSTLDDVLGDLTSIATLRIKLCSHSKITTMEEIKEKLLQFLLDHSQGLLSDCPIDKKILMQISRGDFCEALPDGCRDAFNKWYKSCNIKSILPATAAEKKAMHIKPTCNAQTSNPPDRSAVINFNSPGCDNSFSFRTRVRTSFDVENEIPRLQKWFALNQHPSREQMIVYLRELNALESRKEKKPLDLTNIIYWFKNARAAVRRSTKNSPGGFDDVTPAEDDESPEERLSTSSGDHVPILPNRNAIYVVNPLHHPQDEDKVEVVHPHEDDMCNDDDDDDDDDDEDENENNMPHDLSHNTFKSGVQELHGETNNNHVPMEQEEATDLSLANTKHCDVMAYKMKQQDLESQRKVDASYCMKNEDNNDGELLSGISSSPSVSPQNSITGISSSQAMSIQSPHTALQMAAMSHALSMHYIHPAALYQNSPPISGFNGKDSTSNISPANSESFCDRKKRSRVFIDPLSEIPKLEKWFEDDTHPSSYMIEKYTEELNRSAYRQRFPPLEPKNVQLWFKNHRAKVKRQRLGMEVSSPTAAGLVAEQSSPIVQPSTLKSPKTEFMT